MNRKSVSPIRTSRTPKPERPILAPPQVNRLKRMESKTNEIKSLKEELKHNKDLIKKQKENDLKLARDKIKEIRFKKTAKSAKKLEIVSSTSHTTVKNNLKMHLDWVSDVERRFKIMEEQENNLIKEINRNFNIHLKSNPEENPSLTSRSNF